MTIWLVWFKSGDRKFLMSGGNPLGGLFSSEKLAIAYVAECTKKDIGKEEDFSVGHCELDVPLMPTDKSLWFSDNEPPFELRIEVKSGVVQEVTLTDADGFEIPFNETIIDGDLSSVEED